MTDDYKQDIARRQLGTALALFIFDRDPVSVHCLASGGGEIAEHLAKAIKQKPFSQHALEVNPEIDERKLRKMRTQYWNAMKHSTTQKGKIRDDDQLLSEFDDQQNDHLLFIGWYDYASAAGSLPIEAQVFQVWYFANFPEKLAAEFSIEQYEDLFPDIRSMDRSRKKKQLRRKIAWARKNHDVMSHSKTDRRKLILNR